MRAVMVFVWLSSARFNSILKIGQCTLWNATFPTTKQSTTGAVILCKCMRMWYDVALLDGQDLRIEESGAQRVFPNTRLLTNYNQSHFPSTASHNQSQYGRHLPVQKVHVRVKRQKKRLFNFCLYNKHLSSEDVIDGCLQRKWLTVALCKMVIVIEGESHWATKVVVGDPLWFDHHTLNVIVWDPLVSVVQVGNLWNAIKHSSCC